MHELQLTDAAAGITDVFEDIEALAAGCRFTDCQHETEPGCAVLAAIEDGSLDPARLARPETRDHSETKIAWHPRLSGSHPHRKRPWKQEKFWLARAT